jgi:NAD(P)-dependent dehydrogenase (short-subunit alcohol dehydrogenase family)
MRLQKRRRPGGDPVVALRGEEEPEVLGLRFAILSPLPLRDSEIVKPVPSALITGGSSGIGLAIAEMMRDEGYELTLASRTAEKVEAAARELAATAIAADVSKPEDCERVVVEHVQRCGGLDVLVNSAGIGIAGRVEDAQLKHIDRQLNINVRGLVLVTQAALPHLRTSRGWIVNLASIAGTTGIPVLPIYAASKAAVISLTQSLNADLDGDGVRAIALCPGFVDTPMAEFSGIPGDEMIRPEDCAEVVRMCLRLSPHARIPQVVIERVGAGSGAG